jgi:DtxR family Mn-dependent transcriptional regulator
MAAALSASLEDYLEAVLELDRTLPVVRAKDIAAALNVSRPSVSGALRALADAGLIRHERYGHVELTPAGRERAEGIHCGHETLSDFLRDILQLSDADAQQEACEIEHHLRPETLRRLVAMMEFVRECPRSGSDWLAQMRRRWEGEDCEMDCAQCLRAIEVPHQAHDQMHEHAHFHDHRHHGHHQGRHGEPGESLAQQRPGFRGKVVRVCGWGPVRRRLMEMGVTAGADLEFERVAPLGDPLEIKVRGYHLSLRRNEAEQVWVEAQPEEAPDAE